MLTNFFSNVNNFEIPSPTEVSDCAEDVNDIDPKGYVASVFSLTAWFIRKIQEVLSLLLPAGMSIN